MSDFLYGMVCAFGGFAIGCAYILNADWFMMLLGVVVIVIALLMRRVERM